MQPVPICPTMTDVPKRPFPALSQEERSQLEAWSSAARAVGIDAVEDLGLRPWPVETAASILGVYRTGDSFASWLVVGREGDWSVASCADNTVIGSGRTLADALTWIAARQGGEEA